MKLLVLSLYDTATVQFGNPMFLMTRNQALRSLQDELNRKDPQNALANHPKDYLLFELGVWDSDTAVFVLHDQPEQVARLEDLVHE